MRFKACSSAFRRFPMNDFATEPPKGGTTNLSMRIVLLGALLVFSARASLASDDTFAQAQAAYDAGRYAEASMLYEQMLDNNIANVEVRYNLANAHFKNGDLPQAVWNYRKAWQSAPRDPDIRANLHFALNAAGAAEPVPPALQRFFQTLSQTEWIGLAVGAYIAFTLLLILGLSIAPAKRTLAKLSLLPAAMILVAAGGWWNWRELALNPEAVVVKAGATAFFGPLAGSTAHYKVPLAAIVRQRGTNDKGWLEIEYDGQRGWIKEEYIRRVSP